MILEWGKVYMISVPMLTLWRLGKKVGKRSEKVYFIEAENYKTS